MRIALLNPTYWPEVKRGTERLIHDLAVTLARKGHDVTLLTTHPHRRSSVVEEGIRVSRHRRPPALPGLSAHEYHVATIPFTFFRVLRGRWDLVHTFAPSDACAAVRARRRGGPPVVASFHGVPDRQYLVARRHRLAMHLEIAREADEITVLSQAAADPVKRFLLREPTILSGGVFTRSFGGPHERSSDPVVFCAGSLGDPRKRAALLFDALRRLREDSDQPPRLVVAMTEDPHMSTSEVTPPPWVELVPCRSTEELARGYGSSWITVNAAPNEAFGLVLVESLAAGTPVVASMSGAAPEIVTSDVGRLFEPDSEADLARAIDEGLKLAVRAETVTACHRVAQAFDWDRIVVSYEDVYDRVTS